jgi:RES domain-containing protein
MPRICVQYLGDIRFPRRIAGAVRRAQILCPVQCPSVGEIPSGYHGLRADELDKMRARVISGDFARHGRVRHESPEVSPVASTQGRYHREGAPPPLYASSSEYASWCELLRRLSDGDGNLDVSPTEIKVETSSLRVVNLPVLDLTDERVRRPLGVSEEQLVGNDYDVSQAITELLRERRDRFGGILAPCAAARGEQMIVVFYERIPDHVRVTDTLKADPHHAERFTAAIRIAETIAALGGAAATIAALLHYVL